MNDRHLSKGVWIASGSPFVAEIAAESGFNWILLDLEHGCLTEPETRYSLMATKGSNTKAIVRVGKTDPVQIARLLDWGTAGIMLPHVSTAEQARECLKVMNYPPAGNRGYTSSARSYAYGNNPPINPSQHPQPIFIAQIEDLEGVNNAPVIAAIPGVDVLFVGPSDLKLNLKSHSDPIGFHEALQKVTDAARIHQKQAGILVKDLSDLPFLRQNGYTCLALGSDIGALRKGFKEMLDY